MSVKNSTFAVFLVVISLLFLSGCLGGYKSGKQGSNIEHIWDRENDDFSGSVVKQDSVIGKEENNTMTNMGNKGDEDSDVYIEKNIVDQDDNAIHGSLGNEIYDSEKMSKNTPRDVFNEEGDFDTKQFRDKDVDEVVELFRNLLDDAG